MRWLILLLLALLIGLQYQLWRRGGGLAELTVLQRTNNSIRQELKEKREANNRLAAEVIDLKRGKDAVEERARQDLGMVREGEEYYQIVDDSKKDAP